MATIVIVPGSFCPAECYKNQTDSLARHGISSVVVATPSVGRREAGPATMSDDADEIVRVVEPLLADGKKVVLLTHSYGGIPGTQSLERLSQKARSAQGKSGGIETVIYLASVVLPVGMSSWDMSGGNIPDFVTVEDDYMTLDKAANSSLTFSDLPPEEALSWANRMTNHSTPSFKEKLTYAGYNDVNVHYIACEKDKIIPYEAQSGMVGMIMSSTGRDVQVHKIDCDHAPIATRADDVSAIVKKVLDTL